MLATRTAPTSLTLVSRLYSRLPHTLDAVVGGMLELAIHSAEGLREHAARFAMLRMRQSMSAMATMTAG